MTGASLQHRGVWLLGGFLFLPFILFGTGSIELVYFIGGVILAVYVALLLINFEAGFLCLIFIRSSLDFIKNFTGAGGLNIAGVVSLLLIVLGVFYILYRRINVLRFEDSAPFLVFLGIAGLSIAYSPDRQSSVEDWLRLLSVYSVYILTRTIFTTEVKIRKALNAVLLSALIPVLLAYIQLVTGVGTVNDGGLDRIVGTFLHPNAFASYLLVILIFSFAQLMESNQFVRNKILMPVVLLSMGVFIMTLSRGAWIVFVLAMLLMGMLRYRKILGFFPPMVVAAVFLIPGIRGRIMDVIDPSFSKGRSAWEWRLETWSEIGPMVQQRPIFGHGLATVEVEFGILTHNDYLRLLVETGALGLLAYLGLSFFLLRSTWLDYKKIPTAISRSFQVGLFAMIAGFLVRELADNTLRNTVVMLYFWIFVALVRNIGLLESKKLAEAEQGETQ